MANRTYLPYSGDIFDYGVGVPEHQFFQDVPGQASQAPAPIIVPAWAAVESGGQTLVNEPGGGGEALPSGGAGGAYTPSFAGPGSATSPANYNSYAGSIIGGAGTLAGLAGATGAGVVGGAAGQAIDLSNYVDNLRAAGIDIDPNYFSAMAYGALPSIPFTNIGLGGLFGLDSARQQFEDARREALAQGRLGDNVTLGDMPYSQDLRAQLEASMGRPLDLSELSTLSDIQRAIQAQTPAQLASITAGLPVFNDIPPFGEAGGPPSQAATPAPVQAPTPAYTHSPISGAELGAAPGAEHAAGLTNVGGAPAVPTGFQSQQEYETWGALTNWGAGWGNVGSGSQESGGGGGSYGGGGGDTISGVDYGAGQDYAGGWGGGFDAGGGGSQYKKGGPVKRKKPTKKYQRGGRVSAEENEERQHDFLMTLRNQGYNYGELNNLFRRQFGEDIPEGLLPSTIPDEVMDRQERYQERQDQLERRGINPLRRDNNRTYDYWLDPSMRSMAGGGPIQGPGDGLSDSVPAIIDGVEPARLATDEHVLPADLVSLIGNGSTNVGHRKIARWISQIRQNQTGRARQISPFKGKTLAQLAA